AGFLLLAVGLGRALLRPDTITVRLLGRGAAGAGALAVVLAPFLAPYWVVHRSLGFNRPEELADFFGLDLLPWLDPGSFSSLYRDLRPHRSEGGLFAGVVVLALLGIAGVQALRSGPTTRRQRWAVWVRVGLLLAGGLCLMAIILAAREHGLGGRA